MHHMANTSTPQRVRLTISVSPEVHETFTRMAQAGGMSVSRAMGDWLADTIEAAEHTATMMERARQAPRMVAREVHAYALGLADETGALMESLRTKGRADRGDAPAAARSGGPLPPSGNTGVKVPPVRASRRGKSS